MRFASPPFVVGGGGNKVPAPSFGMIFAQNNSTKILSDQIRP
jgi:hypothetical protein